MKDTQYSALQLITEEELPIKIEMVYASTHNFTGKKVYKSDLCYLHPIALQGLKRATELLKPLNLRLKIWDAFRPLSAQEEFFKLVSNNQYVSDPNTGLRTHCRGIAVDLTIIDHYEHELDMGTALDDFRILSHHGNTQISAKAQRNRIFLAGVMNIAGFDPIDTEWWHYQLPNALTYPIIKPEQIPPQLL